MGNYIPEKEIEEVVQNADIVDIVSDYVKLKKQGNNYLGLCPFHSEKTPSFNVSPEKNLFHCFGCGVGGDIITFLMKIENYTFREAVETLAKREGIQLSVTNKDKKYSKNKNLFEINELVQKFYSYLLWNHSSAAAARDYLQERGIDKSTAEKFGLGYAPDAWRGLLNFLLKRKIDMKNIEKAGLIIKKDNNKIYDRFRHRLMFPIYDSKGRVVGFGGRQLAEEKKGPKYLNSPETDIFQKSKILYGFNWGVNEIRKQNQAIIVEGYMDVIACHQFGFTNAVASLGTSFTPEQAKFLKRNCDEAIIAYDADAAGNAAALRGMNILQEAGCRVKILNLPADSDPDDILRKEGKNVFQEILNTNTLHLIDYKLSTALQENNINTVDGRSKALNFIISDLAQITNSLERDYYIQKIALKLQISENIVYEELYKARKLQKFGTGKDKKENIRHNTKEGEKTYTISLSQAEKILLKRMLEDKDLFLRIKNELGFEPFTEEIKPALRVAEDIIDKNEQLILTTLLNKLDSKLSSFISSLLTKEERFTVNLEDCIKRVKLKHLKQQEKDLLNELSDAEEKGDSAAVSSLMRQLSEMQKSIQNLKTSFRSS